MRFSSTSSKSSGVTTPLFSLSTMLQALSRIRLWSATGTSPYFFRLVSERIA
jgi:hypothetical protein